MLLTVNSSLTRLLREQHGARQPTSNDKVATSARACARRLRLIKDAFNRTGARYR